MSPRGRARASTEAVQVTSLAKDGYTRRRALDTAGLRGTVLLHARLLLRSLFFDHFLRRVAVPPVTEIFQSHADIYSDPAEFVRGLIRLSGPSRGDQVSSYAQEYRALLGELEERNLARRIVSYPEDWRVGEGSGLALYSLVRQCRPSLVVETGVANGHSSVLILQALRRNGMGRLVSVDVSPDAGALANEEERQNWELVILPRRLRRRAFSTWMRELGPVDLFVHDSDHSYRWQALEYSIAWPRLGRGGILCSDDVDSSRAFFDFCARESIQPVLLMDRRKLFGAAVSPQVGGGLAESSRVCEEGPGARQDVSE